MPTVYVYFFEIKKTKQKNKFVAKVVWNKRKERRICAL